MNADPIRKIGELKNNRRVRKGMFVLPSLFTAGNMAAGYFAITQSILAVQGEVRHFDYAAMAIGIAVVCDGLDGFIARMTNTSSEFGRELDSLADVITFGVAPAILAFMWGVQYTNDPLGDADLRTKLVSLGGMICFLFLAASASRLARFNIQKDPKPSNPGRPGRKYFVGMPTPAGAGVIAAVVHFAAGEPLREWWATASWVWLVFATGYLEVTTWRYYKLGDFVLRRQRSFTSFILVLGIFASIYYFSRPFLFLLALGYMLSGVLARLMYALRRPAPPAAPPPAEIRPV